ncbi:MAG: shikimate kinase [Spirochaetales bacterium]|nr:shikimate kinase [Spirochaetales bacterium]
MDNIILIGMPASGKSTLGVLLAKSLGMDFIDTDILIQIREQCALQKIIDTRGLDDFLEAEMKGILSLHCQSTVIATGGSVIYREPSMEHLKSLGKLIFLDFPLEEIQRRLQNITSRGIAMARGKSLEELYLERRPLYQKYADFTLRGEEYPVHIESILCKIYDTLGITRGECFHGV